MKATLCAFFTELWSEDYVVIVSVEHNVYQQLTYITVFYLKSVAVLFS